MAPLVRLVKVNGLQYNRNRDPQAYRRAPGVPFRIQALIEGRGDARVVLTAEDGTVLAEGTVAAPAAWTHELTYSEPGSRLLRLEASRGADRYGIDLRLDVVAPEHA
jgi:hypothetical protein